MNRKRLPFKVDQLGLAMAAALLVTLTGCVAYVDRPTAGSVYVEPGFALQDDYVYYPQYECYYSVSRHQYAYRQGNAWMARPAPRGVSVNVLRASPSVPMNFHDSPDHHHSQVVKQYPKNWKPVGAHPGQPGRGGPRDEHGGQHGN